MKTGWRSILAVTMAGFVLVASGVPSDAARRVARGSSYDGTWSVAIYTLRGDCGALRAALRIIGGRVYSGHGSYQAYGAVGPGGTIRVTLIRGGQSASGSGRSSAEMSLAAGLGANILVGGSSRTVAPQPLSVQALALVAPMASSSTAYERWGAAVTRRPIAIDADQ